MQSVLKQEPKKMSHCFCSQHSCTNWQCHLSCSHIIKQNDLTNIIQHKIQSNTKIKQQQKQQKRSTEQTFPVDTVSRHNPRRGVGLNAASAMLAWRSVIRLNFLACPTMVVPVTATAVNAVFAEAAAVYSPCPRSDRG